ncbi:MAG TPA: asparagine synthase (glutamine-hydrolyzing) [Rhodocyclaceae bacterium]|nr:asparagine synthase (glutamine-hydrolyzing) [Rhodocyclaceae bacterium]
MCGLLLTVGAHWRERFPAALATLNARGPDAHAILQHGEATLGHARLAVIDIHGGQQPMTAHHRQVAMAYNGEIYNFAALKRELGALGQSFYTHSDSEVLLAAYLHWGEAMLPRLDGMFAFAISDLRDNSIFIARDRLGVKPLFWGETHDAAGHGLVVASTLAPFFAWPQYPKHLDPAGLRDYLAFQTPLAPHTLVKEIHALPPATALRWRRGQDSQPRLWWSIPPASLTSPAPNDAPDAVQLANATDRLLAASVKLQLVADVPLGAFLSGGVDSSLLVHYMAEAGARPLKTFSVRFPQAGFDESPQAQAVAARYATEHHVLDAPDLDGATLVAALADLDQPLADPAYIPTWALSQLTRRHVTVALSGDGGDELFAGYPRFLDTADRFPDRPSKRLLRGLIQRGLAPASLTRRALAGAELLLYRRVELGDYPGSRKGLERYLSPPLLAAAQPQHTLQRWRELVESFGPYDRAALLRADLWTYLSENCLTKTDRAGMAHGLEVRVPLLSNALLDHALALPAASHFDAHGGKAILRALARRHLPQSVWDRKKHGFSVPLRDNCIGPWRDWCEQQMAHPAAPWLNAKALAQLWRDIRHGRGSIRLFYTWMVLLNWLQTHPLDVE